jgi:hypothetical protein
MKSCLPLAAILLLPFGTSAQTAPAPPSDYMAEPSKIIFAGIKPGMTANEAVSAITTKALPLFSGYSTPIRSRRTGDDQNGAYYADYGPAAGTNMLGEVVASISLEVYWQSGHVQKIEIHNNSLTYEKILSLLVLDLGKPDITSEVDPDPDGTVLRYAEWFRDANTATDVVKIFQSKHDPTKYEIYIPITIERKTTKALQAELKIRTEWKQKYEAAASDPNPGAAYFRLCATQYNIANLTRARISCEKAIAHDPNLADAYYVEASVLFVQAPITDGHMHFLPGTAEALKKYLELAPTGPHAKDVKDMLDMINGQ